MADKTVVGLVPNTSYPPDWQEITHKDIEQNTWVSPSAVSHWEKRGWKVVAGSTKTAPAADTNKGA